MAKKPRTSIFLTPILEHLCVTGFLFLSPNIRVKLLFCSFDLVAKAAVLNIKQSNGSYGCPTCLHPGEHHGTQVIHQAKFSVFVHAEVMLKQLKQVEQQEK